MSLPPTSTVILSSHNKMIPLVTVISSTVWEYLLYWRETLLKVVWIYGNCTLAIYLLGPLKHQS